MGDPKADAPDPYAERSLHGLWPLVSDPEAPCGLRFADLARDRPEACVSAPAGLPDVALALRTFTGEHERDAWMAAAREFGGNALVLVPGPHMPEGGIQFCLVARMNRDVAHGASTLDEAIPLVRDRERLPHGRTELRDTVAAGAACRRRTLDYIASVRESEAWGEEWAAEIEAIGTGGPLLRDSPFGGNGGDLHFKVRDIFGPTGRFSRQGGGLRVVLDGKPPQGLDADLRAMLDGLVAERGWRWSEEGACRDFPALDPSALAEVAESAEALNAGRLRVDKMVAARRTLLALTIDTETMRTLRRMAEGFPVGSVRYREPAAQYNPRTGKPGTVPGSRVKRLFETGLIAPAWWHEPSRKYDRWDLPVPPLDFAEGILWRLTPTGAAFLSNGEAGVEAASLTQTEAEAAAQSWSEGRMRKGAPALSPREPLEAVVAALPTPPPAIGVGLAKACRDGGMVRWREPRRMPKATPEAIALAGAALAAGILKARGDDLAIPEAV